MRLRSPVVLAASLALAASCLTFAPSASAQTTPPDVVRLRDGSMFRGTISELVANDHVDLVMADGGTRRFAMKEVISAGPAASSAPAATPGAPPPPPPGPPPVGAPLVGVATQRAEVHFESDSENVQFELRSGQSSIAGYGWGGRGGHAFVGTVRDYTTICTPPCNATIPVGAQRIGLSSDGGALIEADDAVVVSGPGTIHGTYTSRRGTRIAGFVTFIGSIVAGSAIVLTSSRAGHVCPVNDNFTTQPDTCNDTAATFDGAQVGVGIGVTVVGAVVGMVLMFQHDQADITFVPMAGAPLAGPKETAVLSSPGLAPQGMALQMRF